MTKLRNAGGLYGQKWVEKCQIAGQVQTKAIHRDINLLKDRTQSCNVLKLERFQNARGI